MIARPRAPVSGKRSFTYPSMVGQKKQTPSAKMIAATYSMAPVEWLIA
jgi:hypothetical protein